MYRTMFKNGSSHRPRGKNTKKSRLSIRLHPLWKLKKSVGSCSWRLYKSLACAALLCYLRIKMAQPCNEDSLNLHLSHRSIIQTSLFIFPVPCYTSISLSNPTPMLPNPPTLTPTVRSSLIQSYHGQ